MIFVIKSPKLSDEVSCNRKKKKKKKMKKKK
jgi:hypothetical protein